MMNRFMTALALCLVLSVIMNGCADSAPEHFINESAPVPPAMDAQVDSFSLYNMEFYTTAERPAAEGLARSNVDISTREQKIILEAELSMATDRFDEVSALIRNIATENDGYVQNSEQHAVGGRMRRLMITIRVPFEQYERAIAQIKGLGVLRSASESQRNATVEYYDIHARLQTKLIEEERLLVLVDRAESIEDILELESLLGQVRTQIEVFQSQMTNIDRLASFSTINVFLDEVIDETTVVIPTNLPERVYESFIQSVNFTIRFLQGVLIIMVRISVPLFVALVSAVIIWGLFRVRRAARRKREQMNK